MSRKKWGRWQNVDPIDEGGSAHVFKVCDEQRRMGALKRLKNPNRIERFRSEVDAVGKLDHPNIVPLIDANTEKEPYWAVFEYEPGGSLHDLKESGELESVPLVQRLKWCEDIALALDAAHQASCVHRDVKPANILLSEDRQTARLCDFGLVYIDDGKLVNAVDESESESDRVRPTGTAEQIGSRFFMPPECEEGRAEEVTVKSDLYSLGKVIYYLASGGRFLAREKHRDKDYDLAKVQSNPYLEAVSLILDRVITVDLGERLESAIDLKRLIAKERERMEKQLPIPGFPQTYRCIFCGQGRYKARCTTTGAVGQANQEHFGYKEGTHATEHMVYLECEVCGNCQRFKLRYGGDKWFPEAYDQWAAWMDNLMPGERQKMNS